MPADGAAYINLLPGTFPDLCSLSPLQQATYSLHIPFTMMHRLKTKCGPIAAVDKMLQALMITIMQTGPYQEVRDPSPHCSRWQLETQGLCAPALQAG